MIDLRNALIGQDGDFSHQERSALRGAIKLKARPSVFSDQFGVVIARPRQSLPVNSPKYS